MKILHIVQNYYPSLGGTQLFFQQLGEHCVALYGDSVTVFTTDSFFGPDKDAYRSITPQQEVLNGVNVHRFSFRRWHRPLFRFLNKIAVVFTGKRIAWLQERLAGPWSPQLLRCIAATDADVIVASSSNYLYMQYPLWRNGTKNPRPFIFQGAIHFHERLVYDGLPPAMLRAIRESEYYLANTVYEQQVLEGMGITPQRVRVLGSAVDPARYTQPAGTDIRSGLGIPGDAMLVVYLGRIEGTKGIDILINAMPLVWQQQSQVYLVIAGYGNSYSAMVQAMLREVNGNGGNRAWLLENITETVKTALLQQSEMLVLPSVNESFGMVFLEAWACRKPVIGMRIGAIQSVVSEGEDGLLVQPGDTADLAKKILQLVNNSHMREKLGSNGYKKTMENYTWDVITEKYRAICQQAIQQHHVQGRSTMDQ